MRLFFIFFMFCAATAHAAPKVLTDIAPVQAIAAEVMAGLGEPDVLLPAHADAHHYALRPSDARRISDADLIIWVGPVLTPWLEKSLGTLATNIPQFTLSDSTDPHEWLDPDRAADWALHIATWLAAQDPDNAAAYLQNAQAAALRYANAKTDVAAVLAPVKSNTLLWPHDGYRYFETAFGLSAHGAIADAHAHAPGPAHIAHLAEDIATGDISCILLDNEVDESWLTPLGDLNGIKTAKIDALGTNITRGSTFYTQFITSLGQTIATCLSQ